MKKIIFLSAFVFICFSCKNPFEKTFEKNAFSVKTDEESEKNQNPNGNICGKSCVNFVFYIKQNDILLESKKDGAKLFLQTAEDYDFYEWHLGAKKISDKKMCEIDFTGYAENEYPIVLYAKKCGIVYSSLFFVSFDGKDIVENHSRTIFPNFCSDSFVDIEISLTNTENQENITKKYENYEMLKNENFIFERGNYKIVANAKIGGTSFSGKIEKNISKNDNLSILLSPSAFSEKSECYGSLEFNALFPKELLLCDAVFSLYKKIENQFSLYFSGSLKNGNLLLCDGENENSEFFYIKGVFEKIESGIYWLRIDGIADGGKKACYQTEYIYIEENIKSEKTIKICDFYDLYKIDYNFDEGFFIGDNLVEKYSSFDMFCLPADNEMFKAGYDFSGWYFDENFTQKAERFHNCGNNSGDLKFYARWEKSEGQNTTKFEFLTDCGFKTTETENAIKVELPLVTKNVDFIAQKADLFIFDLYDKNNKLVATNSCKVDLTGGNIFCEISANFTANEFYLIKVSAFKTSNSLDNYEFKEKVFCGKQVIKPNHNL